MEGWQALPLGSEALHWEGPTPNDASGWLVQTLGSADSGAASRSSSRAWT